MGFLRQVTKLKSKRLKDSSWRKVAAYRVLQGAGDTTATELFGYEAGKSGGMGGLTSYFQGMHKGCGLRERGESTGAVVETCGSRETAEGNVKIYFGGYKGSAAT